MDEFKALHSQQLESMGFPDELYDSLFTQLEETFGGDRTMNDSSIKNVQKARETIDSSLDDSKGGKKIEVIMNPHIVSFDIHKNPSDGLLNALMARFDKNNTDGSEENDRLLLDLYYALCEADDLEHKTSIEFTNNDEDSVVFGENSVVYYTRKQVIELICNNAYLRLVLYRDVNQKIMAALPYPPYPKFIYSTENEEGTIIGPFPFAYMRYISVSSSEITCTFCSLSFLSPTSSVDGKTKYNLELVPDWSCPDPNLKMLYMGYLLPSLVNDIGEISYGLGKKAIEYCKESYAQFVHTLHLKRQKKLENDYIIYEGQLSKEENMTENIDTTVMKESSTQNSVVLLVYTEENDFMSLTHKEAGLTDKRFRITHDKQKISSGEVDIVFSHGSIFSPSSGLLPSTSCVDKNKMINQFPYEGAFVQKDHMAREIQNQHGLPRPTWAIESYDLDVQQREFIGAALFKLEDNNTESKTETMKPLWILKPNKGTQSQGHIVTRNLAQIRKVLDSGSGVSYVAQKYIENPICYDKRKVDCRCIVLLRDADPKSPELYMHNRFYFRIASKKHFIQSLHDIADEQSVLTAMHLLNQEKDSYDSSITNEKLPVDYKTIAKLEQDYANVGFQWKDIVLPKIHKMAKEFFLGMFKAYPAMSQSSSSSNIKSRAIYGLDIMFEISSKEVNPKLTEVTFCPANTPASEAYERDEHLYRNFNNDVFRCLFLGDVNHETITRIL